MNQALHEGSFSVTGAQSRECSSPSCAQQNYGIFEHYAQSVMSDIPFTDQVKALLPLLNYPPCRPVGSHEAIRYLLRHLHDDKVCDFLFGMTEFNPLPILTNSQHVSKVVAVQVRRADFKPPIFALSQTLMAQSSNLLIPVFTTQSYMLGIVVAQQTSIGYKDLACTEHDTSIEPSNAIHQIRFAVDLNGGMLVFFAVDERHFHCDLHWIQSACLLRKTAFTFDRKSLETYHKSGRRLSEQDLARCLKIYDAVDLYRNCPTCNAPPERSCKCMSTNNKQMATVGNKPLLELALSALTGRYQGMGHVHDIANGALLKTDAFGQLLVAQRIYSDDTIRSILDLSIRESMHELAHDPWKSVLPPPDDSEEETRQRYDENASGETQHTSQEAQTEQEIKRKLQTERNRECARRSNLRKKLENRARKEELRHLRDLKSELVAQERELRQENTTLRKLVRSEDNGTSRWYRWS